MYRGSSTVKCDPLFVFFNKFREPVQYFKLTFGI